MKRFSAAAVLLLILLLSFLLTNAAGQTGNGQVGGVVQDASKALIPGVSITLTNTLTGVVNSTVTNEAGAYNYPSVLPGIYRLSAELPGFRNAAFNDVSVGTSALVRLNFTLEVGGRAETVEVSVTAQALLTESSATIGEVLPEGRVRDLPLVSMDALDLIKIMPGVNGDSFAGVDQTQVNTVRDGLSVSDGRFNNGVFGTTVLNPDLIGEIRVILAPVDAEMGRGNAQVQVTTRSGTNRYTGSVVWNVRNSGLDANTWANNRTVNTDGMWQPTKPDWENNHSFTASYGGPIIKNKTFFFTLYEQQLNYRRQVIDAQVMTDTARQGIFRYFDGWNSGNALTAIPNFPASSTTGTYPVVDFGGRPVAPPRFPDGSAYTGSLRCISVFGNIKVDGSPFTAADCPGGTIVMNPSAAKWDSLRPIADSTGYIRKVLDAMPKANYFAAGDGLNTARYRYVRGRHSLGGADITTGLDQDTDRKQINLKIDQNINARNRLSVNWTHERTNTAQDLTTWPGGFFYETSRTPHVFIANFTSTLTPAMVNEARFGIRYTKAEGTAPWERDPEGAREVMLQGKEGYSTLVDPGAGNFRFGGTLNGLVQTTPSQYNGNRSPLYDYADTMSWTRGAHAFKFGAEARLGRTRGYNTIPCTCPLPRVTGGPGGNASPLSTANTALASLLATGRTNAANMLYFLAGSVDTATMLYWIDSEKNVIDGTWETYLTKQRKYRTMVQDEYAFFAKDDWKATRNLTLNLGLRWEYYGSPWVGEGLTATSALQGAGLFGVSRPADGNLFSTWLQPGNVFLTGYGPNASAATALRCQLPACDPDKLTRIEFVGPKTSNPDKSVFPQDRNNFGPAVGFAWQVPWFGQGRTTVRGGYQITFGGSGRSAGGLTSSNQENLVANVPGAVSQATTVVGDFNGQYLDLRNVPDLVPVRPTSPALPGGILPIYVQSSVNVFSLDPNYATPYTQNFTLSLTRNLSRAMTVDVRYVGTVSKKQRGDINLNIADVYYNPELWQALEITRQGGDSPLFDQMFAGLNVSGQTTGGYGAVGTVVNGVLQTGSAHLRRNATFTSDLANGNFAAAATSLSSLNTAQGNTLLATPAGLTGVGHRVLRNGCDRIAAGLVGGNNPPTRCFPENYIVTNPQLAAPTYITNSAASNYHSMQAQFTLRPVHGINFQSTYTWARNLALPGSGYTDPLDRSEDYSVTAGHRNHDFRLNGGFELPIGPNKLLLGNSSGLLARLIERWQTSIIFQMSSGTYGNISASQMFYANGRADIVGPFDLQGGKVAWSGASGSYFERSRFVTVDDPQCALTNRVDTMGFNLFANCTLDAIADASTGKILLQHPLPGNRGTLGSRTIQLAGTRSFDANIQKSFRLSESKTLSVRLDATNVLNNPVPNAPTLAITSANFGQIATKGDQHREFRGQVRVSF